MAQFEVYKNPNARTKKHFPFLVDIQSPVISELETRLVVPMKKKKLNADMGLGRLTPEVEYEGNIYLLLMPQLASVPARILEKPIGSLEHLRDEIIGALDFAITGV